MPAMVSNDAGSRRRKRRRQKVPRATRSVDRCSASSSEAMRKPDSVKNVLTDKNAPGAHENPAWKKKMASSARARRPSRAGW